LLANERQLVLAILSREWKLGPRYASKALNDMIAEGVVWRSWECIGNKIYPRYCIAHDVSDLVVPNDHKRK
jgi:hypothetical protein